MIVKRVETHDYRPDPAFVRELRRYDRRLGVRWCVFVNGRGEQFRRWHIYYANPNGREDNVLTVEEPREPDQDIGAFRPLDSRALRMIRLRDFAHRRPQDFIRELEDIETRLQDEASADARREMEGIASWCRRELLGNPQIYSGWAS